MLQITVKAKGAVRYDLRYSAIALQMYVLQPWAVLKCERSDQLAGC